jgi:hypothetical protein
MHRLELFRRTWDIHPQIHPVGLLFRLGVAIRPFGLSGSLTSLVKCVWRPIILAATFFMSRDTFLG